MDIGSAAAPAQAKTAFDRREVVFLHHVVAVAFPQLPTLKAARKAIRQGRVLVDGELATKHDALPSIGHCLRVQQQRV